MAPRWIRAEDAFTQLDRMSAHICEDVSYVVLAHRKARLMRSVSVLSQHKCAATWHEV
jgi:hypothetical protein